MLYSRKEDTLSTPSPREPCDKPSAQLSDGSDASARAARRSDGRRPRRLEPAPRRARLRRHANVAAGRRRDDGSSEGRPCPLAPLSAADAHRKPQYRDEEQRPADKALRDYARWRDAADVCDVLAAAKDEFWSYELCFGRYVTQFRPAKPSVRGRHARAGPGPRAGQLHEA